MNTKKQWTLAVTFVGGIVAFATVNPTLASDHGCNENICDHVPGGVCSFLHIGPPVGEGGADFCVCANAYEHVATCYCSDLC
jgi:hypothetical protein